MRDFELLHFARIQTYLGLSLLALAACAVFFLNASPSATYISKWANLISLPYPAHFDACFDGPPNSQKCSLRDRRPSAACQYNIYPHGRS
jgi:hypothetical protein